jgi:hypothetical protein
MLATSPRVSIMPRAIWPAAGFAIGSVLCWIT